MSRIIVMGPPGTGVTLVSAALAAQLRARVISGDELYPPVSRRRDAAVDREAWFRALTLAFTRDAALVIATGPLARPDRDRVRSQVADLVFVELVAGTATAVKRPSRWRRTEAVAPPRVDPLAGDERGLRVADDADLESIVDRIVTVLDGRA
ncbi:MAG TPA: shikimate kinase [Microbacterium sp.]|nr:shikimate kinase [Microbacterium sp.]